MKCLVVLTNVEAERGLVEIAAAICGSDEVLIASVIEATEGETLAAAQPEAKARRRKIAVMERELGDGVSTRVHVTVAREGWLAIHELVARERPELLIVGWQKPGRDYLGTTVDAILRDPPCDIAVVRGDFATSSKILVPVRGGRYAQLAVALATAYAKKRSASVTLLHVRQAQDRTQPSLYQLIGERAYDERVEQIVTRVGDASEVIADELRTHDAIVVGATGREGSPDQIGPIGQAILDSERPAMIVRTKTPIASSVFLRQAPLPTDRAERNRFVSELVDKWFVENTFSSSEFADLRRLVEEKERQNLKITVVLPTLNEEATIRNVIRAIRSRLVERFPLVDELIVMDSDSTDRTRDIAGDEGTPVFIHQKVLNQCGAQRGKGEAMWKSLFVTSGDIVVWVDTDIANIHPKFVYGIVGPLLRRPSLGFVKAFYQRPLHFGGELQATGGGRVTELAARPILNLFYPELSGMVQPLSGEQGGRRSLLEQLPFFSGYGVETGLLIDILQRAGLSAIAQVDMKQRIHRNQSLYSLSKMSFEILQVALKRVGEARGVRWEEANSTMKLISPTADGRLQLTLEDITPVERPPMASLASYRELRGL